MGFLAWSRRSVRPASFAIALLLMPAPVLADDQSGTAAPIEGSVPEAAPPTGPYPYVLAIINGGVVTNVAALSYENDYSALWASLRSSNDAVLRVPVGSAGVGWVVRSDGSIGPAEPPKELPNPEDGGTSWQRTDSSRPAPGGSREYPYVLAIINGGVVTNVAALSHENDYTSVWEDLRSSNDAVLRVKRGRAGIGWSLMPDGTIAPPMPRAGMVWTGTEWRAPGTESVERPTDVSGWVLDRVEPTVRIPEDPDAVPGDTAVITDLWASVHGRILVPEDAVDDGATLADIAERSIVMLESYGETIPFLARFDGLAQLRDRLESELDAAVAAAEETTGAPVDEDVADRFRGAARRLAASFLGLFGMDTTALSRGTA